MRKQRTVNYNGHLIRNSMVHARQLAEHENRTIEFPFCGKIIRINKATNLTSLMRDYDNSFPLRRKVVGPYPKRTPNSNTLRKLENASFA